MYAFVNKAKIRKRRVYEHLNCNNDHLSNIANSGRGPTCVSSWMVGSCEAFEAALSAREYRACRESEGFDIEEVKEPG